MREFDYGHLCQCQNCINEIGKTEYWNGFDFAIALVKKAFENSPEKESEYLWEEIEEEVELYKKDG